jgi:hypothetical protein
MEAREDEMAAAEEEEAATDDDDMDASTEFANVVSVAQGVRRMTSALQGLSLERLTRGGKR